jgi:hypothetical protein
MNDSLLTSVRGPDSTGVAGDSDWVIIRQKEIPEEQQIATEDDLPNMIAQLESGQSARTALSACPVTYGGQTGGRKAYYTLTVYVHRSAAVDPEMEITLNGTVLGYTGPTQTLIPQSESWDVNYNATQQLGWRAYYDLFSAFWEIAFNEQGVRIIKRSDLPEIEHRDGFVYLLGEPVFGTFRARGTAAVDVYTTRIEHTMGTKWTGGLHATAWWPKGVERKYQNSTTEEMFVPSCVEEKFNECADQIEKAIADGYASGVGDVRNGHVTLLVDDCNGEVIGKDGKYSAAGCELC